MTQQNKENIALIAERIINIRDIMEISAEEMAQALQMPVEEYLRYEEGETDFSFSFLYTVADQCGLDITDLLTGESARLAMFTHVPAGEGLQMQRRTEYAYHHLGYLFKNKVMEPFLVTVEPSDINAATHKKSHIGQEFNYILQGSMTLFIGEESILCGPGDAVYFNSQYPHAMQAEGGKPCQFLAIIAK